MAPPSEPPAVITLRIKVPPGYHAGNGSDVFDLGDVPTAATIGRLRQNIERSLPSQPAPANQRLLYGGRALVDNEQTIAEALNTRRDPTQTEYVVHLLVKGEGNPSSNVGGSGTDALRRGVSAAAAPPPGIQPATPNPAQQAPQHHHHHHHHHEAHARALAQHQELAQHHARVIALGQQAAMMQPGWHAPSVPQQQTLFDPPRDIVGLANTPNLVNGPDLAQDGQANPAQAQANRARLHEHHDGQTSATIQAGTEASLPSSADPQSRPQPPQGNPHPFQHVAHRPVSGQGFHLQGVGPNGQHIQIHQQVLNFPGAADPQRFTDLMGRPPPVLGTGAPSALDRARENMAEMQRMLNAMRNEAAFTEPQQAFIANMQERAQSVHSYIDPLAVGGLPRPSTGRRSAPPTGAHPDATPLPPPFPLPSGPAVRFGTPGVGMPVRPIQQSLNPSSVTCYLLSSPQGPQALLLSPEHGRYHGHIRQQPFRLAPTPTATPPQPPRTPIVNNGEQALQLAQPHHAANAANPPPNDPVAAAVARQAEARVAQDRNPMQAILGHFWLLLRVMVFAYFLLGSNMGWKRPVALAMIGLGFWLVRTGLFGDGGVARRWWDGIVAVRPVPGALRNAQGNEPGVENGNQPHPQGLFPTPEQVAQRLLDAQNAPNRDRAQQMRELVRPVERVLALFVASLWPGVGEERVRLQEAEERRAREEEVDRQRRGVEVQEAEKKRAEELATEEDGEKSEGGAGGGNMVANGGSGSSGEALPSSAVAGSAS